MAARTISRYEIRNLLGKGGMATVFRAYDPQFEREVAVKVLPRELLHREDFLQRFRREARTIAALEHPAIVPVYDFGEADGQLFLVMRLMAGGSLKERLDKGQPLTLAEIARLFKRLAAALDYAHQRGVIHRDLKPGNILFDQQGEPYLADFGIVRLANAATTITHGAPLGTPAYMSPEQGRGTKEIDLRSDVYALGAMLFEMFTGRVPYESDTPTGQIIQHITEPIPQVHALRPDLPKDCQTLINRAMAKQPQDRYATVGELAADLELLAAGKTLPKARRIAAQPAAGESRAPAVQIPWGWLVGGLALLALIVVGVALSGNFFPPAAPAATETASPTVTVTLTPAPTISAEFPAGFAQAQQVQGVVRYQAAGKSAQLLEVGATVAAGEDTFLWTINSTAELELSDGTRLFLGRNTTLYLVEVSASAGQATRLRLQTGSVLVESGRLVVETEGTLHQAQVSAGWLGVIYLVASNEFVADCLSGVCQVSDGSQTQALPECQRGAYTNSGFNQGGAEFARWVLLGGEGVPATCTLTLATPTETPTPGGDTPTATLTSTVTPTRRPGVSPSRTPTPTEKPEGNTPLPGSTPTRTPTNTAAPPTTVAPPTITRTVTPTMTRTATPSMTIPPSITPVLPTPTWTIHPSVTLPPPTDTPEPPTPTPTFSG